MWGDVPNRFAGRCVLCQAKVGVGNGLAVVTRHGHRLVCSACSHASDAKERTQRKADARFRAWKAAKDASPYARCFICDRKRRRVDMEFLDYAKVYRCRHHEVRRESEGML